jgi:anhydro-N-acetylmuramic acid kinase
MSVRAIGLMSGTSLDGIDAALVRFDGGIADLHWSLERFVSVPYTSARRRAIHDAIVAGTAPALCRLHADLGEWFAETALQLGEEAGVHAADIDVIGCHGQTIWHDPPRDGVRGATLQLGCPATIAERTGIPVVNDFRARDVAAGGHGAPLVPWIDRVLFALPGRTRIMQNIGGIANLTIVPPRGSTAPLVAFDTGPGNALIDAAAELATNGTSTYDADGALARRGRVDETLLAELMTHPYYAQQPPKSTGRETFGRPYVQELAARLAPAGEGAWADLIATLTALTVRTIAQAVQQHARAAEPAELVVTGGGARNPVLIEMLRRTLAPLSVRTGGDAGIDPDAKEAIAFAALAWAWLEEVPANEPGATGARGSRVLGSYTPGARAVRS